MMRSGPEITRGIPCFKKSGEDFARHVITIPSRLNKLTFRVSGTDLVDPAIVLPHLPLIPDLDNALLLEPFHHCPAQTSHLALVSPDPLGYIGPDAFQRDNECSHAASLLLQDAENLLVGLLEILLDISCHSQTSAWTL